MEKTNLAAAVDTSETCPNCRHSKTVINDKNLTTACVRFPPMPVGGVAPMGNQIGIISQAIFPVIQDPKTTTCGEFKPKLAS